MKAVDLRFLFNGHFNLLSNKGLRWAITAIICLNRFGDIRSEVSICNRFGFNAEAMG
jgi:hypothetical protein